MINMLLVTLGALCVITGVIILAGMANVWGIHVEGSTVVEVYLLVTVGLIAIKLALNEGKEP